MHLLLPFKTQVSAFKCVDSKQSLVTVIEGRGPHITSGASLPSTQGCHPCFTLTPPSLGLSASKSDPPHVSRFCFPPHILCRLINSRPALIILSPPNMTDPTMSSDAPGHPDETADLDPAPVQLRYPTIDSGASLESLLYNSTPASCETLAVMAPGGTTPPLTLEESWASLDTSDFSHDDDDARSESTDAGSLVDISSAHDTESAVEEESRSEGGAEERRHTDLPLARFVQESESLTQSVQQQLSTYESIEDTLILQCRAVQSREDVLELEYVRDQPKATGRTSARETIVMAISQQTLSLPDRPVRISYYGAPASQDAKDDLLGKIGAALVAPSSTTSSRTSLTSTCFNIVPTEFGPGSKPAFADLIPTQAQMAVDELALLKPDLDRSCNIRFALNQGMMFESRAAGSREQPSSDEWRPDLLVMQVGYEDDVEAASVTRILELAARHCWPTIIVAKDATVKCPYDLGCLSLSVTREIQTEQGIVHVKGPIDLDSFIALDTDQLSRHIEHIIQHEYVRRKEADKAVQQRRSVMENLRQQISGKEGAARGFVLHAAEAESHVEARTTAENSLLNEVTKIWSTLEVRRHVKDTLFTLIVMMLGIYIVSFSQNLSSKSSEPAISNGTTDSTTTTVTATLAINSATNTAAPPPDHEVVLYDPASFEQMWHRLLSMPVTEPESEKACDEDKGGSKMLAEPAVDEGEFQVEDSTVDRFTRWLRLRIGRKGIRAAQKNTRNVMETSFREEKQLQIREMHRALRNFYKDVSRRAPKVSKRYLKELVTRSQGHLKKARWSSEKGLERLVSEQKELLSRAQHQVKHLFHVKKRRHFFGRG